MKTIAIIASCDTKRREVAFMRRFLSKVGVRPLVVDMAIGPGPSEGADISREELFSGVGLSWQAERSRPKGELIELMTGAVKACVLRLYRQEKIHGVLSAGGVQNTLVAVSAMQALPIGFPKVMATTIACGRRSFDMVVGTRDIVVIPSVSDFTGVNLMTETILSNACACAAGMVCHAGKPLQKTGDRLTVGVSLMGITNDGAYAAVEELERLGLQAIGFHTTGVGGAIMEELAKDGILDGILDLTTHEITSEFFGGGFSYGAMNRLVGPAQMGLPLVVSTGGLDFVDFAKTEFPPRMDERVYNMHNQLLAHIKILPDEAGQVGKIFAQRLNLAKSGVRLLLPTEGMRKDTRPGQRLYSKETDEALYAAITETIGENVRLEYLPGNLDDKDWGVRAARLMVEELKLRGKLPPESPAS